MTDPIAFSGSPLDRAAIERRDPVWIEAQLADPAARFLPLCSLDPLVKLGETRALAWARAELFDDPTARSNSNSSSMAVVRAVIAESKAGLHAADPF